MKTLKTIYEVRAYTEDQAKEYIEEFRTKAPTMNYTVAAAGYTHKVKKSKGEIIAEAWVCKCVAEFNTIWDEDE